MIEKNPKVKKFDLEFVRSHDGYTTYRVVGLTTAYYGSGDTDYANGACGLIKQKNYPGYCQLCFVYHTDDSDHYGNDGCTVEFMPLVTKDGERILVKYEHDSLICIFERGLKDYGKWLNTNEEVWTDGTITFLDNGYCNIWDEEKIDENE